MNAWPISTQDLRTKYLSQVQSLWYKLNILFHDYFWSGAAMCVLRWLKTVAAV